VKKAGVLNQPLSAVIAGLGHLDTLVVGDAGLPVPEGVERVDLAVSANIPRLIEVVAAVFSEMQVQGAIVASELPDTSPDMYAALREVLADIPVETVPHTEFKSQTCQASAVVRTGEFTPYANVILIAGVVF
jgi:D-ribose pyranase